MVLELLVGIAGLIYGYVKPGKEDKMALLKKGSMIGLALGVIFSLLSLFLGAGLLFAITTIVGVLISVIYLTIIFIVGTFIGDWLEIKLKKA
ncbi:MAG: hypothetical protein QMC85_03920 [Methanocellales archaeon]|nr:hypothetical protein [Methanocellales archaeon]MDI6859622.1 hypothetical protein [Methanocellales archaeon]